MFKDPGISGLREVRIMIFLSPLNPRLSTAGQPRHRIFIFPGNICPALLIHSNIPYSQSIPKLLIMPPVDRFPFLVPLFSHIAKRFCQICPQIVDIMDNFDFLRCCSCTRDNWYPPLQELVCPLWCQTHNHKMIMGISPFAPRLNDPDVSTSPPIKISPDTWPPRPECLHSLHHVHVIAPDAVRNSKCSKIH